MNQFASQSQQERGPQIHCLGPLLEGRSEQANVIAELFDSSSKAESKPFPALKAETIFTPSLHNIEMVSSLAPAASLQGDAEETALIARAGALARQGAKSRGHNEPGPYIGLSYYKVLDGQEGGEPTGSLHVKRSAKIRRRGSRAGRAHLRNAERGGSGVRKPNKDVVQAGAVSGHARSVTVDLVTGASKEERESVTRGPPGASVWGTVSEFVTDRLELLSSSDSSDSGNSDDLAAVNSFVLVGPSGLPVLKYNKTHPVPIVEDEVVPGERGLAVAETGLGTMSAAVCFDFRFPELLRQSGQER